MPRICGAHRRRKYRGKMRQLPVLRSPTCQTQRWSRRAMGPVQAHSATTSSHQREVAHDRGRLAARARRRLVRRLEADDATRRSARSRSGARPARSRIPFPRAAATASGGDVIDAAASRCKCRGESFVQCEFFAWHRHGRCGPRRLKHSVAASAGRHTPSTAMKFMRAAPARAARASRYSGES